MIDWNKPLETNEGLDVRILCRDKKGSEYPVIGLIAFTTDMEKLVHWNRDGIAPSGIEYNLRNKKTKKWINIYRASDGRSFSSSLLYSSEEDAIRDGKTANVLYIVTVPVEY